MTTKTARFTPGPWVADAYIMINAAMRLANKLEDAKNTSDSVVLRQLAEYIERTVVPIELRRP